MIKALENPHYKKIGEKVIMNRYPEAKSLEEALEMEAQKNGCILYDVDSKRYFTVFECNYTDEESISLQCISDTGGSTIIRCKKANSKQEILGRPITLENILMLLAKNGKSHNEIGVVLCENGNLYIKPGTSGKYDFEWECSKHLHEQSEETWETTSEFINQKKEFKI